MRSVKNGKLCEDIPARSFCRSAQHALQPVQQRQRVKTHRDRPARVFCIKFQYDWHRTGFDLILVKQKKGGAQSVVGSTPLYTAQPTAQY